MTLSQRLTRAGVTFVLFGSVAALIPENSNALASIATCGPSPIYVLSESPTGPSATFATLSAGGRDILYSLVSTDGGVTYQADPGQALSASGAVKVTPTTNASGAARVTTLYANSAGSVTETSRPGSPTFTYTVGP